MKRITKIRIPKGKYCRLCKFLYTHNHYCALFDIEWMGNLFAYVRGIQCRRCTECLKTYPNGAVFELKEQK